MAPYPMALITQPGKIEFEQRQIPVLQADEVLIRVRFAAICGSDLHLFKGKHPSAALPSAVGHELSGEVVEVGRSVEAISVGDLVTVEPVIACGSCYFCQRGKYHLCQDISFHYRRGQGAFGEYFVAPARHTFKLPANVSLEEGALVEPLSVALHAVNKSGLSLGASCAVFGAGAIGLLTCTLASRITQSLTFSIDIDRFRLQKALEMGASVSINSREEDPVERILHDTAGLGADFSFEAVGIAETLAQSLRSLRKGGLATLIGIFEEDLPPVPINLFIQKEISLSGSQGYNWDFQRALRILETNTLNLKTLITHRFPLAELQDAFALLLSRENQAVKVIIEV
jgi:2-desacetyl-2-hydroxyethyl bacteriochlorophyllide A dehydrogenase